MARAIWTGALTFGLVTVPVGLYTATEDHTVHFHQLQRGTGDRVRYNKINESTGEELDSGDIVKGYDLGGGEYVIVEPEELEEIAPGKSRVIDMAGFVDLDRIEPVFFERTYYLAPQDKEYLKVYELLRAALERSGKAGIATMTMRNKEYLTALRAQDDVLILHTMHWADEVRDPREELDVLPDRQTKVTSQEIETAQQLIDALSMDWDPEQFHDTSEERVKALVDAKRDGQEIVSEAGPPEATNVIDLMEALQRSVEQARSSRGEDKEPAGQLHRLPTHNRDGAGKKQPGKKAGAGHRGADGLESHTKTELYELASKADIPGRSKMNRQQLINALRQRSTAA
ncbi:non-homologous end joining protein Ku [Streptomyces candidus]|nr:non-homologous end joining protein Ku [Streptomyces candidus]